MKKLFTIITLLCLAVGVKAQITVDNFEGRYRTWDAVNSTVEIRANTHKSGINLSNHVLFANRTADEVSWAGSICHYAQAGYKYLHAYMYRNNSGTPFLKVSDTNEQDLAPMNTIVANEWQDVVWNISAYETGIEFIFFMVDHDDISEEAWVLIDEVQLSNDPTPRTEVVRDSYTLVWNADFTSASLPANWNIEDRGDGCGNNELQYYCNRGVSLGLDPNQQKHCLILTAAKESYKDRTCTSGRVNTMGHTCFQYGKIEARIWFPNTADGLWPAFWMMGNDINSAGWPACGEADIIELGEKGGFGGAQDRYINAALHWGPDGATHSQDYKITTYDYSLEDGFHTYTCIWTRETICMYIDRDIYPDKDPIFVKSIPVSQVDYAAGKYFHKPFFVLLNLAVGGDFTGLYSINQITALTDGPRSMYIDWVRIYQQGEEGESFYTDTPSDPIEPDNTSGIESVTADGNPAGDKILSDGHIFIRRGENTYTLTGQIIR